MENGMDKSWFAIDGRLEDINFDGPSYNRFPKEVVERVVHTFTKEGGWVLDPFVGLGTTLQVAQRLGRFGVGFETDTMRAEFAREGLHAPNVVLLERAQNISTLQGKYSFDLVLTSPPYMPVRLEDDPWGKTYFQDMKSIFQEIKLLLNPGATVVVEVSNIRRNGGVRPLAWQLGELFSEIYAFQGEVIRCNTSDTEAGPGFHHSYLLVYKSEK